jgi:hypothetical protein
MSNKWNGMPGYISAEAADAEPRDQRLFPEEDDECTSADIPQPNTNAPRAARSDRNGSQRSGAGCRNASGSASSTALTNALQMKF